MCFGIPVLAMWSACTAPYHAAKHSAVFRTRPLLYVRTAIPLYMASVCVDGWVDGWVLGQVMGGWV